MGTFRSSVTFRSLGMARPEPLCHDGCVRPRQRLPIVIGSPIARDMVPSSSFSSHKYQRTVGSLVFSPTVLVFSKVLVCFWINNQMVVHCIALQGSLPVHGDDSDITDSCSTNWQSEPWYVGSVYPRGPEYLDRCFLQTKGISNRMDTVSRSIPGHGGSVGLPIDRLICISQQPQTSPVICPGQLHHQQGYPMHS